MNSFNKAFNAVMGFEGGYSIDPDDVGGETFQGVSRVAHPDWQGWKLIDESKVKENFPKNLNNIAGLKEQVKAFYKNRYWNIFCGDSLDDALGMELFDIAVNLGKHRAIKYLQIALNLLNRNEQLYSDIVEDGLTGRQTRNALKLYLAKDGNIPMLVKLLNIRQGYHYMEYMTKSPTQEKYARGWLKRVTLTD